MSLLPADLREALTQARLNALGARSIHGIGERVSRDKGAGLEFADHRGYQPGDDMRHLDVSVYSRLRQPVVRQFHPERQLDVVLLVDGTASMDFGTPNKFVFATRVAAGLACAGLAGSDRVTVGVVGSGSLQASRRFSGTHRFHELSAWLEEREPSGHLDLEEALEVALPQLPTEGLLIIVSDFLSERSDAGLATLAAHGPQVVAIQVLDTGEIDPDLREGDVRMVDSESGSMLELAVRDDVLQRYREELDRFQRELRESLASFGNHFVPLRSDASLRSVFLHDFVREGLLR